MGWRDEEFLNKLKCKVLVVGAGGIGCELLKNLVLTGFSNIEVIDLDTIDVSNLNRQFLFRREHVGQPKAKIAVESVRAFCPNVNITYHHDSVLSEKYGVDFFQQFSLVLGALDNRAARRHVNRLCLAAKVPMIDSGSAGYRGQVSVIVRNRTECYECVPKPVQKTYPGCTIRNTPSEPVHCVVWAKHLFNQLFGEIDVDDEVSPDPTDEEVNGERVLNSEFNVAKSNGGVPLEDVKAVENHSRKDEKKSLREWAHSHKYDAKLLFHKLFNEDIKYLLSMSNLWKERRKPTPLDWNDLPNQVPGSSRSSPSNSAWTALQCKEYFESALETLKERVENGNILVWDKDDEVCMHFVAACANLRAYIFDIPVQTLFELKSIAGNIIPAIATTNAIVGGLIVVEALKLVFGLESSIRNIFIQPNPSGKFWGKLLSDERPVAPNPKCYVCSERREITLKVNSNLTSLHAFESKFLKGCINMVAPDVVISGTPNLIISSEDELTEKVAGMPLKSVGVVNGVILECDDFQQKFEVRIRIAHSEEMKADEFLIIGDTSKENEGKVDLSVRKRAMDSEDPYHKRRRISNEM